MVLQRENVCQGQKPNYEICTHYEFGNVCICTHTFSIHSHLRCEGLCTTQTHTHPLARSLNSSQSMQIVCVENIFSNSISAFYLRIIDAFILLHGFGAPQRQTRKKSIKIVMILSERINHCIYSLTRIDRLKIKQRNSFHVEMEKKLQTLHHKMVRPRNGNKYIKGVEVRAKKRNEDDDFVIESS